ncbi:MAG: hypothetical protein ABIR70_19460 [Bryobacteraceae bacterium]
MLKKSLFLLLSMLCPLAFAQSFGGPGVLSGNNGSIGQRSGQDVDLKFFVNANSIYDTGLTPYAVTQQGTLVRPGALKGIEAGLGAYGKHTFRRSSFGLDYSGNFRHYPSASRYDGSNQQLRLAYIYQKSRKLLLDFSASAGTQSFGTAFGSVPGQTDAIVSGSSLIFDNRTSYLQTSVNARYALSGRTTMVVGGDYYTIHRQSSGLVGVNGYSLNGAINHRLSRNTIVGVSYQHSHYDFPRAFGEADINTYSGDWSTTLGRSLVLAVSGGVFLSDVQGVQSTALDPSIAALLGIGSVQTIFYQKNVMPVGRASITKLFRHSSLSGQVSRSVMNGNGIYLTSRQEQISVGYSYTGFRKWSLSVGGTTVKLDSLGQNLLPYRQYSASSNLGYNIRGGFQVVATYNRRYQDVLANSFLRDSARVSFGIYWSPGSIPISFH